jgi:hypothetical protein
MRVFLFGILFLLALAYSTATFAFDLMGQGLTWHSVLGMIVGPVLSVWFYQQMYPTGK